MQISRSRYRFEGLHGNAASQCAALQRDFQELTGVTIQEYVTERRLDAAVRLLTSTPDKVEWIANVVGWSSRKNLNRALARRRGVNPGDIRRPGHARMKAG